MWRELICDLGDGCEFCEAATADAIEQAEKALSIRFPDDLRTLLLESNGVWRRAGIAFIWPVERIVVDNTTLSIRSELPRALHAF